MLRTLLYRAVCLGLLVCMLLTGCGRREDVPGPSDVSDGSTADASEQSVVITDPPHPDDFRAEAKELFDALLRGELTVRDTKQTWITRTNAEAVRACVSKLDEPFLTADDVEKLLYRCAEAVLFDEVAEGVLLPSCGPLAELWGEEFDDNSGFWKTAGFSTNGVPAFVSDDKRDRRVLTLACYTLFLFTPPQFPVLDADVPSGLLEWWRDPVNLLLPLLPTGGAFSADWATDGSDAVRLRMLIPDGGTRITAETLPNDGSVAAWYCAGVGLRRDGNWRDTADQLRSDWLDQPFAPQGHKPLALPLAALSSDLLSEAEKTALAQELLRRLIAVDSIRFTGMLDVDWTFPTAVQQYSCDLFPQAYPFRGQVYDAAMPLLTSPFVTCADVAEMLAYLLADNVTNASFSLEPDGQAVYIPSEGTGRGTLFVRLLTLLTPSAYRFPSDDGEPTYCLTADAPPSALRVFTRAELEELIASGDVGELCIVVSGDGEPYVLHHASRTPVSALLV